MTEPSAVPSHSTLRVLYRAAPGANRKHRPMWFTKWLCLGSFLRAAGQLSEGRRELAFFCDGRLPEEVESTMRRFGRVELLDKLGNSKSYLHVLTKATDAALPAKDGVYLVEDDYLHLPDSLAVLYDALDQAPDGSYFTLYDHPDRYARRDDLRPPGRAVELLGSRHWLRVESTNMTFATTVETLRRDRPAHWAFARFTNYPHDRALWRTVQGLAGRRPARWAFGRRAVLGSIPALATHCDEGMLAPTVDWAEVAESTRAWMKENGMPNEVGW